MCNHIGDDSVCAFPATIYRLCFVEMTGAGQRQQATGGKMRLICPNCGAQYEVPDEVIPEAGRDVQCSNCGQTWFQNHPDHPPAEGEEAPQEWEQPSEETPEPAPEPEPEPEQQPEPEPETEPEKAAAPDQVPETPPKRELDPALTRMLQEEAERETRARAADQGGLETQPDLGLGDPADEPDLRTREARARMAKIRGLPDDPGAAMADENAGLAPGSRRNLLPDIEEFNSNLDTDSPHENLGASAAQTAESLAPARRKGGFRRGFMLIVLLAVIGAAIYVMAPTIAARVPVLDSALAAYVEMVNQGRIWLKATISGLLG